MSSISSFDTESVDSEIHDSESIKSKTPDSINSINSFDSDSSSASGQSELENSPTERTYAAQERKAAPAIHKQRSGSRGLSSELESPNAISVEEESSDGASNRSSTSPESATPEAMSHHSRKLQKTRPSKSQSNHVNTIYAGEWKEVSKLIRAQDKQLKKQRQDVKSLTEIVKSLKAKAPQTGLTPATGADNKKRYLFQPTKQSPRNQFVQSRYGRSPQTPLLGTDYPTATERQQPVQGARSRHANSIVRTQRQPCLPVESRQEQECNDKFSTATRDILNFKISDLGVFDPEQKTYIDRKHQACSGRDYNIFSDVHSWIQSVGDNWSRINSCELDIVTRNLWTLLEGPAIVWWRSQLTQNDREQLQTSKEEMLQAVEKEFRLDISDAIGILETSKFDHQDIMGEASIQTFAYKIFRAAKACGGTSNEHLLTRLYLAPDPDLQVFVNAPKHSDVLSEYVQMLEEKIKAYRRRENTEAAVKVHLVGRNRRSCDESLHSTGNGLRAIEGRNGRGLQNVNKRNELYTNNWPYERHEYYYHNRPHFPQPNVLRFQRMVPHPYRHDRRRDVGEDSKGQQGHNRGGRNEYYDYEFDTNDLEDHWNPYRAAHGMEEHTPNGFNHQRIEFNGSSHEDQHQPFRGRYYGQHEQNSHQSSESLNRWPLNEGLRNDYHPRLLGPPEDEGNSY